MYFSRITVNESTLGSKKPLHMLNQDSYQDHQLIWNLFPERPDAERDFLFRREEKSGWPLLYVVSAIEPRDTSGVWRIESKRYAPLLQSGQTLAFSVRVNPVVSRWIGEEERRHQVRHDIVMDAKKAIGYRELPVNDRPDENALIHEAGLSWLQARCQGWGFSVIDAAIRVDGYRQHRVFKRGKRQPIRYSALDYTGVLRVEDPALFKRTIFSGVGKARGLGCGLLLVRSAYN
jgi:CRISPR system Cascade subunit CasE